MKCILLPEDLTTLPNIGGTIGGRDSASVRGVPAAPYGGCRAKFESAEVFWRVVATVEEL